MTTMDISDRQEEECTEQPLELLSENRKWPPTLAHTDARFKRRGCSAFVAGVAPSLTDQRHSGLLF